MEPKRLKIFVAVKRNLAAIGFGENFSAFDRRQSIQSFLGISAIILQFVYSFYVASTARENMESVIMTAAGVITFIAYISMHVQFDNIFIFIDEVEQFINESKYTATAHISNEIEINSS